MRGDFFSAGAVSKKKKKERESQDRTITSLSLQIRKRINDKKPTTKITFIIAFLRL